MKITETAPAICEDCGKIFYTKYGYICKDCLKRRNSERAKKIGLNRLGNEAYSKQQAEIKLKRNGR